MDPLVAYISLQEKAWARRVSIEVPGFEHDAPIPAACRVGSFLITSVVSGKEPYTGKMPEGIEAQCDRMFATVRLILEAAGGQSRRRSENERLDEETGPSARPSIKGGWKCSRIRTHAPLATPSRRPTFPGPCWCNAK